MVIAKDRFPGATGDKEGTFQKAHGGTLFLDEIGDMSLKTQSKVLRTLDEQRFVPVGSDEPITVDARVIASTNKDLEEEISRGNFREDLFYRLNVIPFSVPPLRERKEDVPLLARHFLKEFSATYGRRPREITDDAIDTLMRYSWPGNVRELRNVIERIVIMNPDHAFASSASICPRWFIATAPAALQAADFLHAAPGPRCLRARLYTEKTGRESRQREPHRRSAGAGAQPSLSQDENLGDCGQRE